MRVRGKQETLKAFTRTQPQGFRTGPTSSLPTGGHTSKPSQLSSGPTVPLRPHAATCGTRGAGWTGLRSTPSCRASRGDTVLFTSWTTSSGLPCRRVSSSTSRASRTSRSRKSSRECWVAFARGSARLGPADGPARHRDYDGRRLQAVARRRKRRLLGARQQVGSSASEVRAWWAVMDGARNRRPY